MPLLSESRWTKAALFSLLPVTIFLFLALFSTMRAPCLSCALALLPSHTSNVQGQNSPDALNTGNTNLIPNPAGRILYYNGTGDVPSYQETSPDPDPITPIKNSSGPSHDFYEDIIGVINGSVDDCSKCIAGAIIVHLTARTQSVQYFVDLLIHLCNTIPVVKESIYAETCEAQFGSVHDTSRPYSNGAAHLGAYYAQAFSKMDATTGDFETYCHNVWSVCPERPVIGIDESMYFSIKPESANAAPIASGETIDVLHLSDWHIDPRYDIGSEANCTGNLCCRPYATNTDVYTNSDNASIPASRFGSFRCDSTPDLALSSFQSMPRFFNVDDLSFAIFTGDIVSHDRNDQISQAYVSYEEEISYGIFKAALGNAPLYATLGNHDTYPQNLNSQNHLATTNAFSWNYELLSSLWQNASWINSTDASHASTHYGAYAHTHPSGLRIISLNTDFWYKVNTFNYWNTSNPDASGILSFLSTELAACESRNQRAWIIGHVPSGYEGSGPLVNPTALFYSIVVRYSPATIAGVFFGHTHQQQVQIFYDFLPDSLYTVEGDPTVYRNTTMIDYTRPLMTAYIGPSITPLVNLNAGYTLYQIDTATFEVSGLQTYIANISNSLSWSADPNSSFWQFEYDAREAYTPFLTSLSPFDPTITANATTNGPLNAGFWHALTEIMLHDPVNGPKLAGSYGIFEVKSSSAAREAGRICNDTDVECARFKACQIRSGSASLARGCVRSQLQSQSQSQSQS